MINVSINKDNNSWCGFIYCLKIGEYIDFPKIVKGFDYDFSLVDIGRFIERNHA